MTRRTLSVLGALLLTLPLLLAACDDDSPSVPADAGQVAIDVQPNGVAAPWRLTGPGGYERSGAGDATVSRVPPGSCTVHWDDVAGFITPAAVTRDVAADSTVTFSGLYEPEGLPFPDTPDKLLERFRTIYEHRDLATYRTLVHPDHVTILQTSTILQFPTVGSTLDVTEEDRIHERMFSGQDVVDPEGMLVPGIQGFVFSTFARQTTWQVSPPSDPVPNAEFALYDVDILLDRGQTYSRLHVQGTIRFYATHRDSVVNGTARHWYELRGQMDMTQDARAKSSEDTAWGTVKALFR